MPVDLSDLDPFSPTPSASTSSSASSLFAPPRSRPSPLAPPAPAPSTAQSVPTTGVPLGADPLAGLFAGLDLDPSPSPSSSSSNPAAASDAVHAQQQRSSRILRDLDRGPFAPASPPPLPANAPYSDEPAPYPSSDVASPSSATPIPTLHRRQSRAGVGPGPGGSFSPPRRLSTLMDLSAASLSHAPSSPPAETSAFSDPFHAEGNSAGAAWRRMRAASGSSGGNGHERIEQALGRGDTTATGDWGDFQTASGSPPRAIPAPSTSTSTGTLGRAASLPAAAVAAAASAANSSGFSSFFGSQAHTQAHPPEAYDRRRPSPSPPVRAATTVGSRTSGGGFDPTAQPIKLVGVRPGVQRVLEEDVAEGIRPSLPPRLRLSPRWTLLYSLDQHGISLTTLFSSLSRGLDHRDGGFVLVVRSERGEIFGAYVSEALRDAAREVRGATRWSGDGSCFLWKATPFPATDFRIGSSVQTFKPTFRNTYYAYATSSSSSPSSLLPEGQGTRGRGGESFLAFGGGEDGKFGLYLDGVFEQGWTGRCTSFGPDHPFDDWDYHAPNSRTIITPEHRFMGYRERAGPADAHDIWALGVLVSLLLFNRDISSLFPRSSYTGYHSSHTSRFVSEGDMRLYHVPDEVIVDYASLDPDAGWPAWFATSDDDSPDFSGHSSFPFSLPGVERMPDIRERIEATQLVTTPDEIDTLASLLRGCWTLNPFQRPTAKELLAHEWLRGVE